MDLKKVIPEEFYKADLNKPFAETVGDLIQQLKRLPKNLPVRQGFDDCAYLTVFNIKDDAFLEISEDD